MHIYVDADACPVTNLTVALAKERGLGITLICDVNHMLFSDYATVKTVDAGADSVDFALIGLCKAGDIVVTQDYGVAAMALGKKARAIHQSGKIFTDENIDRLLMERHLGKEARRASNKHHVKGPGKRTREDDEHFKEALLRLLEQA